MTNPTKETTRETADVVLHIGMGKSASTTIQRALFARHSGICYFGKFLEGGKPFADEKLASAIRDVLELDSLSFDQSLVDHIIATKVRANLSREKLNVISEERLAGFWPMHADRGLIARRMVQALRPSKVLLVIRNQADLILSQYLNLNGEWKPAPDCIRSRHVPFTDYVGFLLDQSRISIIRHLYYNTLVREYEELVGAENVIVLTFEEFLADKPAFCSRLAESVGIEAREAQRLLADAWENQRRVSERLGLYKRLRSHLLPGVRLSRFVPARTTAAFKGFLDSGKRLETIWPDDLRERVDAAFRAENAALAARHGLSLGAWGYPV